MILLSVEISSHPRNFQYVSLWCTISPLFDNITDWTSLFNNEGISIVKSFLLKSFFTPCIGQICAFLWTWEVFRWKWTFSKIHIWTRFFFFFFRRGELRSRVEWNVLQSTRFLDTNPPDWVTYESSRCWKFCPTLILLTFWLFRGKYREKHGQKKGSNWNMGPFLTVGIEGWEIA